MKTFGLLPDRAWIWFDFPDFKHDYKKRFTGLMCVLLAAVLRPVIFRVTDIYTLNSRLDKLISVIEAHISAVSSTFCPGLTHGGLVTYNVCHHDSLLVMDSSLFGAKPLSEPIITWCLLELRNKFVWNFNKNGNVLFGENVSKNVVLKMAAIFFPAPWYIATSRPSDPQDNTRACRSSTNASQRKWYPCGHE